MLARTLNAHGNDTSTSSIAFPEKIDLDTEIPSFRLVMSWTTGKPFFAAMADDISLPIAEEDVSTISPSMKGTIALDHAIQS